MYSKLLIASALLMLNQSMAHDWTRGMKLSERNGAKSFVSRNGDSDSTSTPCDGNFNANAFENQADKLSIMGGQDLVVTWGDNHNGNSQVRIAMAPAAQSGQNSAFENNVLATVPYAGNNRYTSVTIPQGTEPGVYTIQWKWTNYYNCIDFRVVPQAVDCATIPGGCEDAKFILEVDREVNPDSMKNGIATELGVGADAVQVNVGPSVENPSLYHVEFTVAGTVQQGSLNKLTSALESNALTGVNVGKVQSLAVSTPVSEAAEAAKAAGGAGGVIDLVGNFFTYAMAIFIVGVFATVGFLEFYKSKHAGQVPWKKGDVETGTAMKSMTKSPAAPPKPTGAEPPLPDGWAKHNDDEGNTYYFNHKTSETQWERPTV